uniref:F-box associated beta-propeller type 3 domain-containing protein n=2 Tax=Brassica oleracea var. oleracea TaxID=109376 RepID=A0A0D3A1K9_BRAOL
MMKPEKGSRCILEPIPLDLKKLTRSPAKSRPVPMRVQDLVFLYPKPKIRRFLLRCQAIAFVITLGGGGGGGLVSRSRVTSPYYRPMTVGLSINGFMYYAASVPNQTAETPPTHVFVCFDVRNERILSFITTPKEVLVWKVHTSLIEYKGKLAVVVPTNCLRSGSSFDRFDLWILEDVTKHEWSRQSFQLPLSLPFAFRRSQRMISQGTNKAGEIIFSPTSLPGRAQPFYVFYFNPDTKNTRRVRIHGVADTEEFWSRHGLTGMCCVSFSPQHDDSIAFL